MKLKPYWLRLLLVGFLGVIHSRALGSDDRVVIILSSKSPPYQQALEGFQQAFGRSVPSYTLSEGEPKIPPSTRIIVTIGGKAALHSYSSGQFLIYCLAPGTKVSADQFDGRLVNIHTNPSVPLTISRFKMLQPSLKRLAVVWAGESIRDYFDQKKEIADRSGVDLVSDRVQNPSDLPDHLRALKGTIDAIWLPPDAAMVTPKTFATIKQFSLSNGIPFYVPSDGLVEQGATASVSASFAEIGALAALMTRQALDGSLNTDRVYPEKLHFSVNLSSAKACHLQVAPDVLKQAEQVVP